MHRFQSPDFKIGELGLYFALLFHGINGIRILLVDFVFDRSHVSKKLFWAFFVPYHCPVHHRCDSTYFHTNTHPLYYASGGL